MSGINTYNFAVNHEEAASLIAANGAQVSYILEGSPGIGKSSVLKTLEACLGNAYDYIYIDVPMKDIPDIALSMPNHDTRTTMPYVNEIWFGTDKNKPKCIMLDEMFKGSEYVKLMMNRLLLEKKVGDYELPEGSIVYGTTNFQSDGVGDRTNGHTNSRVSRIAMRPPTLEEWSLWAVNNNVHPLITTWVHQNPMVFCSYKDTAFDAREHDDGMGVFYYIYHPQHNNQAYVCPRSLNLASYQVYNMDKTGEALLTKALIGTVGAKAALDMSAMFSLGNELPHPSEIETKPKTARIPKSVPGQMMMVYKSIQFMTVKNIDAYVTYFQRFQLEMTSTWVKTLVSNQKVKEFAVKNQMVREFALENQWVLG